MKYVNLFRYAGQSVRLRLRNPCLAVIAVEDMAETLKRFFERMTTRYPHDIATDDMWDLCSYSFITFTHEQYLHT